MQCTDEELEDFARIYEEEYGEKLSLAESREMLSRLVRLIQLVARPLPDEPQARAGEQAMKPDFASRETSF